MESPNLLCNELLIYWRVFFWVSLPDHEHLLKLYVKEQLKWLVILHYDQGLSAALSKPLLNVADIYDKKGGS